MSIKKRLSDPRWWLGVKPKFATEGIPNLSTAVIIPAYNEERSIADTIRSIKNQTVKVNEIIVVDDCSNDRTSEIAKGLGVTVVRTSKNQGTKAMAQNYVLPKVKADLVVTIDADTLLAPDAIEKTLPYFNDKDTFAVCGFVVPQKIETLWERGRHVEYVFGITILKAAQNNTGLIMVASGCFTIFRNPVLRELGYFNERTMAEDMDLTWEALFKGYKVYCVQDALCYPLDPSTLGIYFKQLRRWYSGFLQNIAIHKKDLLLHWRFGLFYIYYLMEATTYPLIGLAVTVIFIAFWKMLIVLFLLHALIITIPTVFKGWRMGLFWKTLTSIPAYYATRPVNIVALYITIYKEWIIRKRLATWDKGH